MQASSPHPDDNSRDPARVTGFASRTLSLTDGWSLGGVPVESRLVLAPLAGIGSWFVRLQARRHGAGLAVSEMVSSFGVAYGNERTLREFLRIHPEEHPVSIQLFGHDPAVMAEAAARVAAAGADLIDLNMGCPVRKVCSSGAGAALLDDPDRAVAIARAAVEGGGLPVTVKLRPGRQPGEEGGLTLARRLVEEAGIAGLAFHPRHASQRHRGAPDWRLAERLAAAVPVPMMLSGGLTSDERVRRAFEETGAAALMLARGSLGNPWRFERLLGRRLGEPSPAEVVRELRWVIAACEEHVGTARAGRRMRKLYPWYADRLPSDEPLRGALAAAPTTAHARSLLARMAAAEAPSLAA